MRKLATTAGALLLACLFGTVRADVTIVVDHNEGDAATAKFQFKHVPSPTNNNVAAQGTFSIVAGETDPGGTGLAALADGRLPEQEDEPQRNFFFAAGTPGGILQLDLGKVIPVWQVNTYSWHRDSRAPQVYSLYGATEPQPGRWHLIAGVDTRTNYSDAGGQYGVSIHDPYDKLGDFRYLMFVISATESSDPFGNTFYSEIEVLDHALAGGASAASKPFQGKTADGQHEFTIDTSRAPDMKTWAETKLAATITEWYPRIVAYFPSEGYTAPERFRVNIRPGQGVADTAGTRINAYVPWIQKETNGQSAGALVHEMVHVVQQYGQARRKPDAMRNPGWLVEGIADYYRWYHYEPQSHGADIRPRSVDRVHYNDSYRTTANFLNWVATKYDTNIAPELNAAMRRGEYSTNLWVKHTGKTVQQLGDDWKVALKRTNAPVSGAN